MLDREQRWGIIGGAIILMQLADKVGKWTAVVYVVGLAAIVFVLGDWLWLRLRSRSWPVTIGTVESQSITPRDHGGYMVSFGYSYSLEGNVYGGCHDQTVLFKWSAARLSNALARRQLEIRYNPADPAKSVPELPHA